MNDRSPEGSLIAALSRARPNSAVISAVEALAPPTCAPRRWRRRGQGWSVSCRMTCEPDGRDCPIVSAGSCAWVWELRPSGVMVLYGVAGGPAGPALRLMMVSGGRSSSMFFAGCALSACVPSFKARSINLRPFGPLFPTAGSGSRVRVRWWSLWSTRSRPRASRGSASVRRASGRLRRLSCSSVPQI